VNWGDYMPTEDLGGSTIENDPAVDTHLYTQAGTYNVVWNAVYEDADAETYYGGAQDFDAVMTEQVVVGRSPGTASVSDAGSATVGQPYGREAGPLGGRARGLHDGEQRYRDHRGGCDA